MPRSGVVEAVNAGYRNSSGDIVMTISDECRFYRGWLDEMVRQLEDDTILSPLVSPYSPFHYYGKTFSPFPFLKRSLVERIGVGYLFDPSYKCYYADPDLSLRVIEAGGRVKVCEKAEVFHPYVPDQIHVSNKNSYVEQDREVFKRRWSHLGEFKDP